MDVNMMETTLFRCKNCPKGIDGITPGKYYKFYHDDQYYFLVDDIKIYIWFTSINSNSFLYIWDYFYTPQETRKIKLEKLNETTL